MNKGELIEAIALKADTTKKNAGEILDAVLETVVATVAAGDKVTLVGFGSFEPRNRQERSGRNPKTGETMTIPAMTVPAFSAGKQFKEMVAQ